MKLEIVEEKIITMVDRFGSQKQLKTQIFRNEDGKHHVKFKVLKYQEDKE